MFHNIVNMLFKSKYFDKKYNKKYIKSIKIMKCKEFEKVKEARMNNRFILRIY